MNTRRLMAYFLALSVLLVMVWLGGWQASWATPAHSGAQQTVPTATPGTSKPQIIELSVDLQRPNSPPPHPSWSVPVALALYPPGSTGAAAYQWDLALDTSGRWTGQLVFPAGTYDVRVKNLHTLRNVRRGVAINGVATIRMGTLLEGDADGDNRVRASDFTVLRAAYFTQEGDTAFDPRTDFDEDNRIRSSDFALLRGNYFASGDIEVASARGAVASPEGAVGLALEPAALTVQSGDVFAATLLVHAGDQPFVGFDVDLRFPPDVLQVVNAAGQPETGIEPVGALLPLINSANNSAGRILYGAGVAAGEPALMGDVLVARLRFRALQAAPGASASIVDATVADPTGLFVTGPLSGMQVRVEPASIRRSVYVPLILRSE